MPRLLPILLLSATFSAIADPASDKTIIEKNAAILEPAKIKALETDLATVRDKALSNLDKLAKGDPVALQKQHHAKLRELLVKTNAAHGLRWQMIDALRRRREAPNLDQAEQKRLEALAAAALAIDVETALSIPDLADFNEPRSDSLERGLWFYRVCRKIDAYNKSQDIVLNKLESANLRFLNEYREMLGLMPFELDPRLVQSARRHAKEMVDLKYFGHDSPESGASPTARMRKAGYNAGWRENIAGNIADPEKTFWLWFGSPGHHRAMTAPEETAIGVGKWDNSWTHNFGHGPRLMVMNEENRAKALAALSDPLQPQPDNAKMPPLQTTKIETEITVIDPRDPKNKVVVPGPKEETKKP